MSALTDHRSSCKLTVLIAVDDLDRTAHAVEYIGQHLAQGAALIEVVLVSIQPPPQFWQTSAGLKREFEARGERLALGAIRAAELRLDAQGVVHRRRIEQGEFSRTIARCAAEEGAQLVVLPGPDEPNHMRTVLQLVGLKVRTSADRVIEQATVPVLVLTNATLQNKDSGQVALQNHALHGRNVVRLPATRRA